MMKWLNLPVLAGVVGLLGSMPEVQASGRYAFDYTMAALMTRYVDASIFGSGCMF